MKAEVTVGGNYFDAKGKYAEELKYCTKRPTINEATLETTDMWRKVYTPASILSIHQLHFPIKAFSNSSYSETFPQFCTAQGNTGLFSPLTRY